MKNNVVWYIFSIIIILIELLILVDMGLGIYWVTIGRITSSAFIRCALLDVMLGTIATTMYTLQYDLRYKGDDK